MLDFRTPRPSIFIDGVFDMGKKGEMRKVLAILSWILLVSPFAMADTLSNPEFSLTTTSMPSGAEFSFIMSASGNFSVDWGDGSVESITKTGNVSMTYSHTYASPGTYTIGMSGAPTGYGSAIIPSISFNTPSNIYIASLSGSLGAVFSTLESGETPRFIETFSGAVNLTSVSSNLFDGATGGIGSMFDKTFYGCSGITSISENLFSGINKNVSGMFNQTFYGCSSLSNIQTQNGNVSYIIPNMFRDITGTNVFNETFNGTGLMTNCPDGTMSDTRELFLPVVSCLIPTNYSINYVMNGGTNFTGAPESYVSGTGVTIAGVPTRSGYGFSGWCTDSALKNCSFVPVISADSESDKTFYAKWTSKPVAEFTITTTAMPAGTNFELTINAYGIFTISWGTAQQKNSHTNLEQGQN